MDAFKEKIKLLSKADGNIEKLFAELSEILNDHVIRSFADKLERDGDKILTSVKNMRIVAEIDKAYETFVKKYLVQIVKDIIVNAKDVSALNAEYFKTIAQNDFSPKIQKNIEAVISERLGVGANNTLKPGGYMDNLLKDTTIKNQIKESAFAAVTRGDGFDSLKKDLQQTIKGDKEKLGAFQQHYRQFAYDVHTQIDRLQAYLYAQELGLEWFVYEGTIIESSREFCEKRNGQIFHISDTEQWRNLIGSYRIEPGVREGTTRKVYTGPIVPDAATYNPIIEMGGFGCRHMPRFISKGMAERMKK